METKRAEFTLPDGGLYSVTKSTEAMKGELVEMEVILPKTGVPPPVHFHPDCEEEYVVLSGTLELQVAGKWHTLKAGESYTVPRGTAHTFRNADAGKTRMAFTHKPAVGFEAYMDGFRELVQSGRVTSLTSPKSLMHISLLWERSTATLIAANPFQRAAMSAMASIGKLLGYKLS